MPILALLVGACVMLALPSLAGAQSQAGKWEPLGMLSLSSVQRTATLRLDANMKRTAAIRLLSEEGAVHVKQIDISYATGRMDYVRGPLELKPGVPSDPLAERNQVVTEITLHIAEGGSGPVRIVLSGLVVGQQPIAQDDGAMDRDYQKGKYLTLDVYFATTRKRATDRVRNEKKLASFNGDLGTTKTLGKAVVTIPRDRAAGTIPRPILGFSLLFRKENPAVEFTLAKVDVLDPSHFYRGVSDQANRAKRFRRQAFVFVHGFNVQFDDALYHAAQLAHDMNFDGPAIAFSWPSGGSLFSYAYDKEAAKASRNALRDFLAELAGRGDIDGVNIIAHSMGNEPLVDILNEQAVIQERGGSPLELKLKEVVFAAPDVSRQGFSVLDKRLHPLVKGGGTLYVSGKDLALGPASRFINQLDRAGYVSPSSPPLIISGVDTIDMTQASWIFSLNHSTFSERRHLIDDLELLFTGGKRPPHERYKVFRPVEVNGQKYWRYE